MRLDEITRSNRVWAIMRGIDYDIDVDYNSKIRLLKNLMQLNSPRRVAVFKFTIDEFKDILLELIDNDYSGFPNPADMKRFKSKCKRMLDNIHLLENKLPK